MTLVKKIIELKTENDILKLTELSFSNPECEERKERLIEDFKKGYFKAFFILSSEDLIYSINSVQSYVIVYNSYSSWQNRVLYISKIWIKEDLSETEKYLNLEQIRDKLFSVARNDFYNRINFNIEDKPNNKQLIEWITNAEMGAINLSKAEDWLLFEMQLNAMKSFLNKQIQFNDEYKILKVNDMSDYASQIRNLIKEISIFEKMEDQFKTSLDDMLRDYNHVEHKSFDNQTHLNRFYEAMVVLKNDQVIGYSLYYMNYEIQRGRGCYLEDLYIQEKYRRKGLGTALWKKVIEDCLLNNHASFMQWTVLAWNKPAIELYKKFDSIDLTYLNKLNLFRFVTEKIYR